MTAKPRKRPPGSHTDPSSEWYSTPQAKRRRPLVGFTLSPDAADALARLSERRGEPKSVVVEALIMAAVRRLKA